MQSSIPSWFFFRLRRPFYRRPPCQPIVKQRFRPLVETLETRLVPAGPWTNTTQPMTTGVYRATATLLNNGEVLVAGGGNSNVATAAAELYNPSTGTWIKTGDMTTAVFDATATLLNNGMVLVAGGVPNGPNLSPVAELYNPSTGGWTNTGNMTTAVGGATATLLNNGEVLVAGGYDNNGNATAVSELYNPSTGGWTTITQPMTTAVFYATATLLNNGQVLVAGGNIGPRSTAVSELYNPSMGTWTDTTGPMTTAVEDATATLLNNGKVLVAGGSGFNKSELYNPSTGTWTNTGPMTSAVFDATATLLNNGMVLVAGGIDRGSNAATGASELYNPSTGTWTATAGPMTTAVYDATAALLNNGQVLVAGGATGSINPNFDSNATNVSELFALPPTVTSLSPAVGPAAGGTSVTITGNGFTGATAVDFGTTAAASFTVNSDTSITAISPAGSGSVHVTVTMPNGTFSATSAADEFAYLPNITPATLTNGQVGVAYSQTITASGDTAPYTFSLDPSSNPLPAGLNLASNGKLSGTPTAGGTFTISVDATDSSPSPGPFIGTQTYTFTINAANIVVGPMSLPGATAGLAYNQTFTAGGGTGPYTFAVSAGNLPAGEVLNVSTGALTGTPTAGGNFNFTISATDSSTGSGPYSGSRAYSVFVDAITLSPATLANGQVGVAYSQTITASGDTAPYTFSLDPSSNPLPAGLNLASTGKLGGTPTAGGTFTIIVDATDSSPSPGPFTGTQSYTFTINAANIVVGPTSLPGGTVGVAFNQTFTASGGTGPYVFAVTAGSLPAGEVLDVTTGALSGTPTAGGNFNFTISATDSSTGSGPYTGSRAYTIFVDAPTPTAPTVTSPTATNITATTATLGGNVTSDGGATLTQVGIVYALTSVNPHPTIGGTGVTMATEASPATGVFTLNVGGLSVNSGYSFAAFATNSVGTGYTGVSTFITTPGIANPSVVLGLTGSPFAENGGTATVTASLSGAPSQPVTVLLAFTGTAVQGTDYSVSATSIIIPAGQLSGSITLTGLNSSLATSATVIVSISGVTNGTPGSPSLVSATINGSQPLGAGFDELGAYRPSNGSWSLDSNGQFGFQTGPVAGPAPLADRVILNFSPAQQPSGPTVIPVSGDWAGIGTDEIGDFENGTWHLDLNNSGVLVPRDTFQFGTAGDVPVPGDYITKGQISLAVWRPFPTLGYGEFIISDSNWLQESEAGQTIGVAESFIFGAASDHVVVGDWNGAGLTEVGVYRDAASYIKADAGDAVFTLDVANHHTFDSSNSVFVFGLITDQVVIGDWDGTGTSKVGVYRPATAFGAPNTAVFSLDLHGDLNFNLDGEVFLFGLATDKYVTGKWAYTTGSGGGAVNADLAATLLTAPTRNNPTALDAFFAQS